MGCKGANMRLKGTIPFSANLEPNIASPLDSRLVVQTLSNLTDSLSWQSYDGQVYLYVGIIVSVIGDTIDNNGVYYLKDVDFTDIDNWINISKIVAPSIVDGLELVMVSNNYNIGYNEHVLVRSLINTITITLPGSGEINDGDHIKITDVDYNCNNNNITLLRNGMKIFNKENNTILNKNGISKTFMYFEGNYIDIYPVDDKSLVNAIIFG